MDQAVVAGIGNVYRAEILYRHRIDPYLPGRGSRRVPLAPALDRPRARSSAPVCAPGASSRPTRPIATGARGRPAARTPTTCTAAPACRAASAAPPSRCRSSPPASSTGARSARLPDQPAAVYGAPHGTPRPRVPPRGAARPPRRRLLRRRRRRRDVRVRRDAASSTAAVSTSGGRHRRRRPPWRPNRAGDHPTGHLGPDADDHSPITASDVRLLRRRADRPGVRRRARPRGRRPGRRRSRRRGRPRGLLGRVRARSDLPRRLVEQDDHGRRAAAPAGRRPPRHRRPGRRRRAVGRRQPGRHAGPARLQQLRPRRPAPEPGLHALCLPVPPRRLVAGLRPRHLHHARRRRRHRRARHASSATAAPSGRSPVRSPRWPPASRGPS